MHRDCPQFFYSEAVWIQSFETQERKRKTGYKWIDDVHHRHLQQQKQHHYQPLHAAYLVHMRKEGKMERFPDVMMIVMVMAMVMIVMVIAMIVMVMVMAMAIVRVCSLSSSSRCLMMSTAMAKGT